MDLLYIRAYLAKDDLTKKCYHCLPLYGCHEVMPGWKVYASRCSKSQNPMLEKEEGSGPRVDDV